ncbi:MAG: hypothetical protein ACI4U5_00930 [Bacilli bacterium]
MALLLLLSPSSSGYDNAILIENFEIVENEDEIEICFDNKIDVPFSLFKININKNFHESFKVDLGYNKITIDKDYIIDVNQFTINWDISTGLNYSFDFVYIKNNCTYMVKEKRYYISRINELDASFISLKDNRWIEFRKNDDYLYLADNKLKLSELGFFICNKVEIKNIFLQIDEKYANYPYSVNENNHYQIPLAVGSDNYLHYLHNLSSTKDNEVFFSSSPTINDEIIFKNILNDEYFKILLSINQTEVITNNLLYEFDIKTSDVINYPSDIFKFIYE